MEVIINNEIMTLEQFARRQVHHELHVATASFDTMSATLECEECSRVMKVGMHDNGNLLMSENEVVDRGDLFALHSYCPSGECPNFGASVHQED